MHRECAERVEYKDFVLARCQETVNGGATQYRWDIIDSSGLVVATVTVREHAESYVDHHVQNE